MIIVRVELWSARTHEVTELARVCICNEGQNEEATKANYSCYSLLGRDHLTLNRNQANPKGHAREGKVTAFPKKSSHVWNLVARALKSMDYK